MDKIKLKKGIKASLPVLDLAEPAFVTDESRLYIGSSGGNIPMANKSEIDNLNGTKVTQTTGVLTYYVDATLGNDSNPGTGATVGLPFKTIGKAISILPQAINHNTTINVADGTYNESVLLKGFVGSATLTVKGNTVTPANCIINNLSLVGITCAIVYQGFNSISTTVDNFYISNCCDFFLSNNTSTSVSTHAGVSAFISKGTVVGSTISNKYYGIVADSVSNIISSTNSGTGNTFALYSSHGSVIAKTGTQPSGTTSEGIGGGGKIISDIPASVLSANGYRYNDDGTITQWGTFSLGAMATNAISFNQGTFPIVFPNALLGIYCSVDGTVDRNFIPSGCYGNTNIVTQWVKNTSGSTQGFNVNYFAIGR